LPGKISSIQNESGNSIIVTFTQKINNTIEDLSSFEIINFGYPNSISPANQFSYLLTFNSQLKIGNNFLITKNLKDYYGSSITADTVSFIVDSVIIYDELFITSYEIINPYLIKVTFNLDVDEITALNTQNYIFNPDNKATSISIDDVTGKTIFINLKDQKPVGSVGIEYRLKIENLVSSVSTGNIKINSGAGSYIVLSSFAKDLSGVYVYPSPIRMGEGNDKLTFANLPQKAKITIWTLDGKQLFNLEENNGDGGVDFNLKDDEGNTLNTGIYIYRIVRLDILNNEVEEKIGKFAVIR